MRPKISVIVPVYNVEDYLVGMLKDVENQTFRDFEVLMVDDGSTDLSGEIIDEFARMDTRFRAFHQENKGAAEARNLGIDEALGDYAVFWDGDDSVPKNALEKLYKAAVRENADMVVGIMQMDHLGERNITVTKQLARQKVIPRTDIHFINALSCGCKMFRLGFIREEGLRFESIKHSEDGVFTYKSVRRAGKIAGCDSIVYTYVIRPFWGNTSATQVIDREYLEELFRSHDRITEEALGIAKEMTKIEAERYISRLFVRFLNVEMLGGFYRRLWRSEEDIVPVIADRMEKLKDFILPDDMSSLIKANSDIFRCGRLLTREELLDEAEVNVLMSGKALGSGTLPLLKSLLNQTMPKFRIIMDEDARAELPADAALPFNAEVVPGAGCLTDLVRKARGEYVYICEPGIFPGKDSFRKLIKAASETRDVFCASAMIRDYNGRNYSVSPEMSGQYGPLGKSTLYGKLDKNYGNKLFHRSDLAGNPGSAEQIAAGEPPVNYNILPSTRTRDGSFIRNTRGSRAGGGRAYRTDLLPIGSILNRASAGAVEIAKKRISSEDAAKILRVFGKKLEK
ncbi:MAG: glycosyltransferase family 2 protein [Firmicutes bacterium]|nr:glycosyltransferase family 2 protein [Bacillota bacterium]